MSGKARSMFFRLAVPVFCVILALFSVGMGTMSSLYVRWYTDASVRSNTEILGQTATSLDIIHRHLTKVAYSISYNTMLQSALSEPLDSIQREWRARRLLSQIFADEPTTIVDYEITIVGVNGISAASGNGGLQYTAEEMLNLPVFREAVESRAIAYTSMPGVSYSTRGERIVVGCQPLTRAAGTVYGAIFISFVERNLREFYKSFVTPANDITLLAADGTVLSATNADRVGTVDSDLLALCVRLDEAGSGVYTGEERAVVVRGLPYFRAYLVSTTAMDELLQPFRRASTLLILVWLAVLMALLLSIAWIIQHALRPLRQMAKQMNSGSGEHIPERMPPAPTRELQSLTDSYNQMLARLRDYLGRLEREHQRQKEYELALLQMQINPHFLYNTLDSVKHLVHRHDASRACEIIDSLVSLLRSSLGKSSELVTVEDEVQNARHYINIMQPRYGNLITAHIQMQPDCAHRRIPGLILQPFIENAFFHGFQKSAGGSIRVYVGADRGDPGRLYCEIIDNGDGIPPNLLEELRAGRLERRSATRIGIQNVRERLEMLYPGQSAFEVISEYGYGVSIQMSFPD